MIQFNWPQFKLFLWKLNLFCALKMSCPWSLSFQMSKKSKTSCEWKNIALGNKIMFRSSSPFLWLCIWRSSIFAFRPFVLLLISSLSHLIRLYILDVCNDCQTLQYSFITLRPENLRIIVSCASSVIVKIKTKFY